MEVDFDASPLTGKVYKILMRTLFFVLAILGILTALPACPPSERAAPATPTGR